MECILATARKRASMNSPECEVGARKLRLRHGLGILQGLPSESSKRNQEVERCKATLLARQTGTAASPSRPFPGEQTRKAR
jgi:hypothetical protein